MTQRYLEMADHFHLLVSGGSDCHGMSKGKPLIGSIKVPYECVERMRERVLRRAVENGIMLAGDGTAAAAAAPDASPLPEHRS